MRQLTKVNDAALEELDLPPMDTLRFVGAQGDSVFGWLIKPPAFDSTKQYPLIYLIHGGPQSAWLDQWHARWNYALFASRGYVVAAVNFHGSTGYGQVFTNSISRNWGGLPYEDLMKGVEVVSSLPYVDKDRIGAAGASYGGYMIYWMAGQTDRFKVLVAHDGILNPLSMTGTTEELWFPAWEFGGTQLSQVGRSDHGEMVSRQLSRQMEDPDAGSPRPARLPGGPLRGAAGLHRAETAARPLEVSLLPR